MTDEGFAIEGDLVSFGICLGRRGMLADLPRLRVAAVQK